MSTFIPERCSVAQINEGMNALLEAVGCTNPDGLRISSIHIEDGVLSLAFLTGNKEGGPIVFGDSTLSPITTQIKVGLE